MDHRVLVRLFCRFSISLCLTVAIALAIVLQWSMFQTVALAQDSCIQGSPCDGGSCAGFTCEDRCGYWKCTPPLPAPQQPQYPYCGPCAACTPLTCQPEDCGLIPDGCGGTLQCSSCPSGSHCENQRCVADPEPPRCGDGTCTEHCSVCPQDCGTCDGSGGDLGLCSSLSEPCKGRCGTWTCQAGGGQKGTINCPPCPCTPLTCQAGECGSKWDGCSATIECGGCPSGTFCSENRCVQLPPPCGQGGPCEPCQSVCGEPTATCRTFCTLTPPDPHATPQIATCQAYANLYPDRPNACVTCLPDPVCTIAPYQASLACAAHGGVYQVTCNDERNVSATYVCQDLWQCTLTCDGETHEIYPDCGYLCTGGSESQCNEPFETCENCPQDCGQCPVGDEELSVLTYNVQFLPFDWAIDHSSPLRAILIGNSPTLKNYDVIVFQEAFEDRPRQILKSLLASEYPYQTRVLGADVLDLKGRWKFNGGVFIASRWPILIKRETIYYACNDRFDCAAAKGVQYARINKLGRVHHVYGTHTDADLYDNHYMDRFARGLQLAQMRLFMNGTNPLPDSCKIEVACPRGSPNCPQPACVPRAELMAGDFNVKRGTGEYLSMLATLHATAPEAFGFNFPPATNHDRVWIDYVLYSNARPSRPVPEPTGSSNEVIACTDAECPWGSFSFCPDLSDHHPVVGLFSFPEWGGSALEQTTTGNAQRTAAGSSGNITIVPQDCDILIALAIPQPIGPSGVAESDIQRFSWTPVAGADKYRLLVTEADTNALVVDVTIPETSFTPEPFAVPGRQYRWSLTALRGSEEGPRSAEQVFTYEETAIPAPEPIGPFGNVRGDYPTFSWNAVPGATLYELEVMDESGQLVLGGLVPPTPLVVAWKALAVGRQYSWTVTALRGTRRGPESAPMDFVVTEASGLVSPESVGPMGPVESGVPTFAWNKVSDADSYEVSVIENATGEQVLSQVVSGTSFVSATALAAGYYQWTVRAMKNGVAGPQSVTLMFNCLNPNRPPSVTITSCGECEVPCAVKLTAWASDPDGDELSYSWSGCASGDLPTATCTLRAPGRVEAMVTVSDGRGGTALAPVVIVGRSSNRPPVLKISGPSLSNPIP